MNIETNKQYDQQRVLMYFLLLFYLVYIICAVTLQTKTYHDLSKGGSAFDIFTGSALMTISVFSLLISTQRFDNILRLLLWLGVSAAAGAIAIDEWFEFHEKTRHTDGGMFAFGDDDYSKIVLWFCAGLGIYVLYKIENLSNLVLALFLLGFSFQSIYLALDMGDGDFYTLPLSQGFMSWSEEVLELLSMQSYLASVLFFHQQLYLSANDR